MTSSIAKNLLWPGYKVKTNTSRTKGKKRCVIFRAFLHNIIRNDGKTDEKKIGRKTSKTAREMLIIIS